MRKTNGEKMIERINTQLHQLSLEIEKLNFKFEDGSIGKYFYVRDYPLLNEKLIRIHLLGDYHMDCERTAFRGQDAFYIFYKKRKRTQVIDLKDTTDIEIQIRPGYSIELTTTDVERIIDKMLMLID